MLEHRKPNRVLTIPYSMQNESAVAIPPCKSAWHIVSGIGTSIEESSIYCTYYGTYGGYAHCLQLRLPIHRVPAAACVMKYTAVNTERTGLGTI